MIHKDSWMGLVEQVRLVCSSWLTTTTTTTTTTTITITTTTTTTVLDLHLQQGGGEGGGDERTFWPSPTKALEMRFDALERSEWFEVIFAEKVLDLFVHPENTIMFKVSTSNYFVTILTIVTIEMTMIMMLVMLIFDMVWRCWMLCWCFPSCTNYSAIVALCKWSSTRVCNRIILTNAFHILGNNCC